MPSIRKIFDIKSVPFFVFTFPVFVDILNGILQGAASEGDSMLGILYRGALLAYSIPYLKRYKYKKLLFLLLFFGGCSLVAHIFSGGFSRGDVVQLIKIIYGFFFLAILLGHKQFKDSAVVFDYAIYYGFIAGISIVLCKSFGLGYSSYVEDTFGFRGFFIATNDVGLVMLMTNALSLYRFFDTGKWCYFLYSLGIAGGCALVGSMACYLGTIALYAAYILCPIFVKTLKRNNISSKRRAILSFIVIIGLGSYAAIQLVNIILEDSFLSLKYADVGSNITENSGRSLLISAGMKVLEFRPFEEDIVGSGDKFLYEVSSVGGYGSYNLKGVESDFWDLYGCYGGIFVILMYLLPVYTLFHSIRLYIKRRELIIYWIVVITLIFLGHSYYGGHAFTSPLSMSYYVITIYMLEKYKEDRKQKLGQPAIAIN